MSSFLNSTDTMAASAASAAMFTSDISDVQLAIELYLEDYDCFIAEQKGKGRMGEVSDKNVTAALWKDELHSLQQNLADHRLASSMANAIAGDQHLISQLQREDEVSRQDRAMAIALAENREVPPENPFRQRGRDTKSSETESVCEVIGSLAQLSVSEIEPDPQIGSSSRASRVSAAATRCVACMEPMNDKPLFLPACSHMYCRACLREVFLAATRDEELYPPRCCKNVFPPGLAMRLLAYRELAAFSARGVEFSCTKRTYCADPRCSTFIPPWQIHDEIAECPQCHLATHVPCNALMGAEHDCPSDEALQQVLAVGEAQQWRRCPGCRTYIELSQGCNHITCR